MEAAIPMEEDTVAVYAYALPILPGKVEDWKQFCRDIGERSADHTESRQRLRVRREVIWLQRVPQRGSLGVVAWETDDPGRVFAGLKSSDDSYDRWFLDRFQEIHGVDLRQPPPMNELGLDWQP